MVWAWVDAPEEVDSFWITLDYNLSTLQTFQCPDESDLEEPIVYFNAKRYSRKRVERYDSLNITGNGRVVSTALLHKLKVCIGSSQVSYLPVCVQTRDGEINGYSVVIIRNCLPCLNPEKSNIRSWVVEQEFTIDYDGITFREDCLGDLDIAADTMTGRIIVSNRLKEALTKTQFKGLYFSQGVDLHM